MRAHADDLRAEVADSALVEQIAVDWQSAPLERLSGRARVLCEHAVKLTRTPAAVDVRDIERLRDAGCDDGTITDITQVVALFAYYNRIADGLGVDDEPAAC